MYRRPLVETMRPITLEDLQARLDRGGPPSPDDVSITRDGRRLDSKEAVLAWWATVEDGLTDEEWDAFEQALTDG